MRWSRPRLLGVAAAVVGVLAGRCLAAASEPQVAAVQVTGNIRVEEDAVRVHLRTAPGQAFDRDLISGPDPS